MKQYTILGLMAISLYACTNDVPDISELKPAENVPVTEPESDSSEETVLSAITVTVEDYQFADAQTRTNIDPTNLSFTWAKTDEIGIYPSEGDQVRFPMTQGEGTKTAAFDGGGWALKTDYCYSAYYPFSVANYLLPYTVLPHHYTGQIQAGNNSTAHLGAYDFMAAMAATPSSGNVTFEFKHLNSLLYLQLTCPNAETFTQLELMADEPVFVDSATVDISTAVMTPVKLSKTMAVGLEDIAASAGEVISVWVAVAPRDMSAQTIMAKLTTETQLTYNSSFDGLDLVAGKAYRWQKVANPQLVEQIQIQSKYNSLGLEQDISISATVLPNDAVDKSVVWSSSDETVATVDQNGHVLGVGIGSATITATAHDGSGIAAGWDFEVREKPQHAYVDLGITDANGKKLLWATCNVGADNPEDYGQYFAWGETTGYGEAPSAYEDSWTGSKNSSYTGLTTKTTYCWTYYKWGTDYTNLYKYNNSSSWGNVDNKTVLEASDDAATANWGGSWRMPTYAEQTKLHTECYWQWVTSYNGKTVNGYVVYKAKASADKGKYSYNNPTLTATYSVTSDAHIFLPAAGYRYDSGLYDDGSNGRYWSSSLDESSLSGAFGLYFNSGNVNWVSFYRYCGLSVRPVCVSSE